jgi:hypothetical protein
MTRIQALIPQGDVDGCDGDVIRRRALSVQEQLVAIT